LFSNTAGNDNNAFGYYALRANTTGYNNSAFGKTSLVANTVGVDNSAFGRNTLASNINGSNNSAFGAYSLASNTTNANSAFGAQALYDLTAGTSNTAIGFATGRGITTGNYNTILGANVTGLSTTLSNNIIIADGQGNRRINVDSNGNVGIGTTNPSSLLEVYNGDIKINNTYKIGWRYSSGDTSMYNSIESSYNDTTTGIAYKAGSWTGNQTITCHNFQTYTSGWQSRLVILQNGNVGIGTTSPADKLSIVNGNISLSDSYKLYNGSAADSAGLYFSSNQVNISGYSGIIFRSSATNITSQTERMRIDTTGQIKFNGYTSTSSFPGTAAGLIAFDSSGNLITIASGGGGGGVTGSGTTSYVARWTSSSAIGTGVLYDNGTNVGIGTTSPGVKLDVIGGIRSFLSAGNYGLITNGSFQAVGDHNATLMLDLDNTGAADLVNIKKSGTSRFYIKNDGNVGIGTTSVTAKFDIRQTSAATGLKVFVNDTTTAKIAEFVGYDNSLGDTTRMVVQAGGSVGIGTTSPTGELHVYGSQPAFRIQSSVSGNMQFGQWDTTYNRIQSSGRDFLLISTDATNLIFSTNTTERMRITSGGNVGIGTTSPVSKLTVQGDINVNYNSTSTNYVQRTFVTAHAVGNRGAILRFGMDDGSFSGMSVENIASSAAGYNSQFIDFKTHEGGISADTRMRISPTGNVGIGTTSPDSKLHVFAGTAGTFTPHGNIDDLLVEVNTDGGITIATPDANGSHIAFASPSNNLAAYIRGQYGAGTTSNLAFYTDSVLAVYMRNGNVGIGTTSPASKLYVVSSGIPIARFDGSSVAASSVTEIDILGPQSNGDLNLGVGGSTFTDATNNIQNKAYVTAASGLSGLNLRSDSGYVQITAGGVASSNEVARFTSSGNVGIGTTNPTNKLEVVGSIAYVPSVGNPIFISNDATYGTSGTGRYVAVGFGGLSNGANKIFAHNTGEDGLYICSATSRSINFRAGGSATDHVSINNLGSVGIGTTSPETKLHIYSSATTGEIRLGGGNGSGNARMYFQAHASTAYIDMYGNNQHLPLYINANPLIFNGGNVGIGTTSPNSPLEIAGTTGKNYSASTAATLKLRDTATAATNVGGAIQFQGYKISTSNIGNFVAIDGVKENSTSGDESGTFRVFTSNSSGTLSEKIRVTSDGNVGIGTTSPSTKLEVIGTITCTTLVETSSIVAKTNVRKLSSQKDKISKLSPVSFNYKNDNKRSLGLIAEEVAKVYPELVEYDGGQPLGVNYSKLTAVLISTVNELVAEVAELKKQLNK